MTWYSMNLQRRKGGVYYYRRAVPEEIRGALGKREIVRSLGTKELKEAKKLAKQVGLEVDQEFDLARSRSGTELSVEEAQRLAERRYHEWLACDAERRIEDERHPHTVEFDDDLLSEFTGEARRALANSDYKPVADTALELLQEVGLEPDRGSLSFKRLAFCLLRYQVQYYERVDQRNVGVWDESEPVYMGGYVPRPLPFSRPTPDHSAAASPPSHTQPETKTPLLSEVLEKWLGERKPIEKTERDWRAAVRRFTELHGDLAIDAIGKPHIRELKDALANLPKHLPHKLREKPLPEIIEITKDRPGERLQAGGVNKYLDAVGSLLNWASNQGYREGNPVTGLKMLLPKTADTDRQPFEPDELKAIFESPVYKGCKSSRSRGRKGDQIFRDAKFWLPLLGLYTGARVEELAQLLVADVRSQGDILYLSIRAGDPSTDKTLKNRSSQRDIPIHPELVRSGFVRYVEERGKGRGDRLFPDLERGSDGKWSSPYSKSFGRYLRKTVGITDTRKVFHSFRHTFKDACRRARLPEDVHDALTGHSNGSVSRTYGAGVSTMLEVLHEELRKVKIDELDLSHLHVDS